MYSENDLHHESEESPSPELPNESHVANSDSPLDSEPSIEAQKKATAPEKGEKKSTSTLLNDFLSLFDQETSVEAKIRMSIEFMRTALSSSGTPRFKDFWEGRKLCLPLFKESVPPKARSQLWGAYIELSTEAKRLKEILDEQSAFAVEQIELAVLALERDLEQYPVLLTQSQETVIPQECITLGKKRDVYDLLQRELQLLNTLASRVNAMRKEVVKTEMRIRIKNKLLERLSHCGDQIFPKRKELIKKVSDEFVGDVDQFIQGHFQAKETEQHPLYALREEIKMLQSIAKTLTLNTHAFTETRLKLSECWDKIREEEKERKKESLQKRMAFKQNFDLVMEKIKPFAEACQGEITLEECNRQSAEIQDFMKTLELGRDEVRALKDAIFQAKKRILDRAHEAEKQRLQKEREIETLRREKIGELKERMQGLLEKATTLQIQELSSQIDEIKGQMEQIALTKPEKLVIDRLSKQLKDAIDEKRERELLNLSDEDIKAIDQLKEVLEERKARRTEVKNQLESYRKQLGGSGFDFEKAMMYREMIETEKALLNKINASIEEIEEKISEIEG